MIIGGNAYIDYSIPTGEVREFELMGRTLYDKDNNIEEDGWEYALWSLIKSMEMNFDSGDGIPSFVYPLIDKYENSDNGE